MKTTPIFLALSIWLLTGCAETGSKAQAEKQGPAEFFEDVRADDGEAEGDEVGFSLLDPEDEECIDQPDGSRVDPNDGQPCQEEELNSEAN